MAAPSDWSATDLCLDTDLRDFESDVLSWIGGEGSGEKWRRQAKKLIEERLRSMDKVQQLELDTDIDDVLDLIGNLGELRTAACYRTLHLLANDVSAGSGDLYDRKAEMYLSLFEDEFPMAMRRLHWDVDESGTIEADEKYTGASYTGVRLKHGG
jgi:hypothetical protein